MTSSNSFHIRVKTSHISILIISTGTTATPAYSGATRPLLICGLAPRSPCV
nr:MAG TPA: hypothetical protein [Caudoviricetes sp.]